MRENLLDAFNNILSNPELKNRFDKIKNTDDVYDVFKDAGYPGSSEELDNEIRSVVEDFVKSKNASDGDLSGVVGGKGIGFSKKLAASTLALMGIASTASGSALHALQGNNMQTTKISDKKQAKSSVIKNIATHGATAALVGLPIGGALIWALMRNQKSPHLQKIYKYAERADKALAEFEKAFTPQLTSEPSGSAPSENGINIARANFRNEIRKIIEGMEKDKLFSNLWKNYKRDTLGHINDDNLNVETAYDNMGTVFCCADIDNDTTTKLIKNSYETSWKIPWKRFCGRLVYLLNNTDLKKDYTVTEKEIFKSKFEEYNLSSNAINGSNVRDLFFGADGDGANTSSGGSQNITNREPILASVYKALQNNDPEGTYDAFIKVLKDMGIAKKFQEKTYKNINDVFQWINQIINNNKNPDVDVDVGVGVGDTFKNLYNFLVKDGSRNEEFINLMKKIAKNDCIEYKDLSQVETQVQNFWKGCNNSCTDCSRIMLNFSSQLIILSRLCQSKSDQDYNLTLQHVQNYQNWKQFHEAGDNAAKLRVLNSFNSGNLSINTEDDFNQAVEQAIQKAKEQARDSDDDDRLTQINRFKEFFDNVKSNKISLSDIGVGKNALDIFD